MILQVLLFSTMTRLLDVMEDYLVWRKYKYLRLDGHTSGHERGALIDKFNNPNSQAFIFLLRYITRFYLMFIKKEFSELTIVCLATDLIIFEFVYLCDQHTFSSKID